MKRILIALLALIALVAAGMQSFPWDKIAPR